jgi:CRP-like cAMP-binding protein
MATVDDEASSQDAECVAAPVPVPKRAQLHPGAGEAPAGAAVYDGDVDLLRKAFGKPAVAEPTLRRLAVAARHVRCDPGPLQLASPRRPKPAWWLVRTGHVSMGSLAASRAFVEKRSLGPGEWLDVAGALSARGTWIDHAVCRTPAELLAVPLSALYEACAQDPNFTQAFGGVLAARVRELNEQLDDMAGADAPVRLARWLQRHLASAADAAKPVQFVLHDRKQSIARQLCITSETLSRTLRRLSDDGLISVKGYELTIHDPAALRALARPADERRRTRPARPEALSAER